MILNAGRNPLPMNLRLGIQSAGSFDRFAANNTPLPRNAQEVVEAAVTRIGRAKLQFAQDLISAGLTTPLPGWWGIPSIVREAISQSGYAKRSFVPDTRGERQVINRSPASWPVFCTSDDFSFNIRTEAIANRVGYQIGTEHIENATYNVNLAIEDQCFNGLTDSEGNAMNIAGLTADGVLSSDTTFTYSTWTTLTGPQIIDVIKTGIEKLRLNFFLGPYLIGLPSNYTDTLTKDYGTAYSKTIIQRISELGPYGGSNLQVKVYDLLPNDRVFIAQMSTDVMDLVVGQQPVPVSWQDGPQWNTYWAVLACVFFRMFPNFDGNFGVAVGSLA